MRVDKRNESSLVHRADSNPRAESMFTDLATLVELSRKHLENILPKTSEN